MFWTIHLTILLSLLDTFLTKSPEGKPHDKTAEERFDNTWVPMDEKLPPEELQELIHAKEARTNAAILESIGDILHADIKPPENVLFVCKLNPVTQDEDLFTIFSRFGTVTSADIIRDYKRGDGQCYAFIGFETKEACERDYFKMKDVLIDDCRIQVDFSQSVSRLWNQYRHCKGSDHPKRGCFKCGATDHIARHCQQGANNKQRGPEYVLKNDQTQHCGDGRKRSLVKSRADEKSKDREYKIITEAQEAITEIVRGDPRPIGIG